MANVYDSQKQLVGVVDVTVLRDQTVMDHLPLEAEEYLYVSGIAVLKAFRLYIYISILLNFLTFFALAFVLFYLFHFTTKKKTTLVNFSLFLSFCCCCYDGLGKTDTFSFRFVQTDTF